ncbi:MAG: DEAD/DEAH box helicase [Actinomycetota bacterium]|nr:DEAD/DEAH box helicase [Actinomycetota bacterium]
MRVTLGEDPVRRGSAYYRTGAVQSLAVSREGLTVLASVRGSHGRTYQTIVTAEDGQTFVPGAPPDWRSRCSCPMQVDCKHVVALILAARERQERQERFTHPPVGPAPAWESALRRILQPPAGSADYAPIALQLELVTGKPSRYAGSPPPSRRLRIRPVTRGKNGGWIRTGMSWRDLEYSYRTPRPAPAQREAALALLLTARSRLGYYGSDQHVHLADLGHSAWRLLHDVRQAGIPLVRAAGQVHLPTEPAALVLDARQPGEGGQLTLSTRLRVPGADGLSGFDASGGEVGLVGEPPHGIVVEHEGDLVLARLDQELEPGMAALLRDGPPLVVPADEVPQFFVRYYPALRQLATVESSDESVTFPHIEAPKLAVAVRFEPRHVTSVRWTFAYAVSGQIVHLSVVDHPDADRAEARAEGRGRQDEPAARDRAAERALLDSLGLLDAVPGLRVPVGGHLRLVPDNRIRGLETAVFVAQVLPALQDREDVLVSVEGTPLDYVEADEAPLIAVSASDSGDGVGTDWFDLGITVSVGGEEVPFGPLFAALANGEGHLILDTGTWFSLDRPELSTLARLIEEARSLQDRESTGLRLTRWHAGLWEELVELGVVAHQSDRWTQTAGALLDLTSIPTPDAPASLEAELRDYQREGYHWLSLLWDHQLGGVLADDMGLGKTLQTLAMATRAVELGTLTPQAPLLIVAPTSVVSTWQREAARFCPGLQVTTVTETSKRRSRPLSETVEGAHLVVTSFAILRLDEDHWRELPWGGLVLDEAQFVKNYQAKTYQVARRLPAPFKLAITGTPLENSLMDLWALLSIVAPGLFPNPQRFTELYRRPIESGQSPELLAALRRRIRPLMLRRTKDEVAQDLPPKIEQVLSVTLNPQHQRIYQTRLQRERQRVLGMLDDVNRNRIAILSSLTVLRQLSLDVSLVDESLAGTVRSSKIDALLENLAEVVAEGHRVLVFSQFTRFLRLVRDRLSEEGIAHVYLDGRTRNRDARIAEFTRGDAPVFLISLKAGGSGLTLTEADYVFVLDPWWNPATEAQAVDRTHRIGQDKTVMVYRMVAEGTIEEKVVALQERKKDLFARVVEADGLLGAPLSADDIRGLLDP